MVKKSKSFIACLLAVLMMLTTAPLSLASEEDVLRYAYCNDNEDEYYAVESCDTGASGDVVIPSKVVTDEHGELPVKAINGYAFINCSAIENIYIPRSVTYIDVNAFKNQKVATAGNLSVTLYGYEGTAAEAFASDSGILYKNIFCEHEEVYENVGAREATCSAEGYTGDKVCKKCEEVLEKGTTIDKLPHTEEVIPAVAATCTETGLTEGKKCSVCGETLVAQETVQAKGHTPGEEVRENIIDSTCSTEGSHDLVVYCTVCKDELSRETETIKKKEHTFGDWTTIKSATCKEDGEKQRDCTKCTYIEKETIPASTIAHKYNDGEITTAPTCKKTGLKTFVCTVCGAEKTEEVPIDSNAHTPGEPVKENIVAATCSKEGSYDNVVYCTVCEGEISRKKGTTEKDPNNHTFSAWHTEKPSTCKTNGVIVRKCTGCDKIETGQLELNPNNHTYDDGNVTTAPTCIKAGIKTFTCTECGVQKTEEVPIDSDAHNPEKIIIKDAKDATCKELGYTGDKYCSDCGNPVQNGEFIPTLDHTPGEAKEEDRDEATCTANGSYNLVVRCKDCGSIISSKSETIDKLPHTEEVIPAVDATCRETGLTEGKKCSVCGEILVAQETVQAKGHTPGEAVRENIVDSTCSTEGSHDNVVYCTVCKDELSRETETIKKKEHTFGDWTVTKDATCVAKGEERRDCENCEAFETREIEKDPNNHVNGYEIRNEKEATCKEKGYTGDLCCVDCGAILEKGEETHINRANHAGETEIKNAKEATCTAGGYTGDVYCLDCGVRIKKGETVKAQGHVDEDKDGLCDVCKAEFYTHETCPCKCHKSGFDKFLFKLALFFQMLFEKNKVCKCGDLHY